MRAGQVFLVGAGPGDPGLVTRLAEQAIRTAETVVYDHLVHSGVLAWVPPDARRIYVGKRRGHQEMPQAEINRILCEEAAAGRKVVRIKGGDPYVFGRGAEEAEALADAGIPFRVIPGITAGIGALAYAGLAVTHRDFASEVAFVTGHDDPDSASCRVDWPWYARYRGTIVIYMGMTRKTRIAQILVEHGMDPDMPVALVERGSWPDQKVETGKLKDLADPRRSWSIHPPGLVLIGRVVAIRSRLDWRSQLPLAGRTVMLTKPEDESSWSEDELRKLGADVLIAPTIRVDRLETTPELDDALRKLEEYDWIVWTSANGVRYFFDRVFELGRDIRLLGHASLAAIGPATAQALRRYGLVADLVPGSYRSEDLANALAERVAGKRVLLARADRGREVLSERLSPVAREVRQVAVYANADIDRWPENIDFALSQNRVDWITLTSSAIARRFAVLSKSTSGSGESGRLKFASISPITSAAARESGIEPTVEAKDHTMAGLISAILEYEQSAE